MKNIDLFKNILDKCVKMIDLRNQMNKIEIPEKDRIYEMSKLQQVFYYDLNDGYFAKEVYRMLQLLSLSVKKIDKEYIKYLSDTYNSIIYPLNALIEYNPDDGNDYFIFAEYIPVLKIFFENVIYEYDFSNQSF